MASNGSVTSRAMPAERRVRRHSVGETAPPQAGPDSTHAERPRQHGTRSPSGQRILLSKSEQMARVRRSGTAGELAVRHALWASGTRYRLSVKLPGSPDLVFARARVAVFVDGCFWHGCPRHYRSPQRNTAFWCEKLLANRERDARVDADLAAAGWLSARVWEHEIRQDVAEVASRLRGLVHSRLAELH